MVGKKRICFLRSNPVNPDSRVEKEVSTLSEAGYIVDIFCWDRESNHKIFESKLNNSDVTVYRVGYKAGFGEGLKSLKPYLKFQLSIIHWIIVHGKEYDYFHACDFDTAFFSFFIVKWHKKKFVFDIFDFICGAPSNFVQSMIKKSQLYLINHADATIICTEQRKEQIKGSKPKKLIVVHNSPDSALLSDYKFPKKNTKKSVVYVGVFLDNRLLQEMISYFKRNQNVDFYIGGFGLLENLVKEAAEKYDNIHFMGKLSYDKTLALENSCDIMTAIYDPSVENHRFAASNKFYESLFLGKPVLMVRGTGMAEVVENEKIGAIIDYSEEGFAEGMSLLLDWEDEWESISVRMKRLYSKRYNWDVMKNRLVRLYQSLDTK